MTTAQLACLVIGAALGFLLVLAKPLYYSHDLPWVAASIGAVIGAVIGKVISNVFRKPDQPPRKRQPYETPYR